MKKLKILELTNYSSGICGVWQRVRQESIELAKKGYEVRIFSTNATKGSKEIASSEEKLGRIEIKRFPFKKLGGESFMLWNFTKQALEFEPDIIIAHSYRHPHTLKALEIKKKLKSKGKKCRVFLVTHGPFIEGNLTRSFLARLMVNFYDKIVSPKKIIKFDKIIVVAKWEIQYLLKLGCKKEQIVYIPNSIPKEFFEKNRKIGSGILFLGRIAEIKNLETLIKSIKKIKNKNLKLDIIGPINEGYKQQLVILINYLDLKNKVRFLPAIYDLKTKINKIDKYNILVLPSKYESFGFVILEAMARGKIVISSKTNGGKEIIEDKKNGFLFNISEENQLAEILNNLEKMSEKEKNKLRKNAIKSAKKFQVSKIIDKWEELF